jgi:hypothetical protein
MRRKNVQVSCLNYFRFLQKSTISWLNRSAARQCSQRLYGRPVEQPIVRRIERTGCIMLTPRQITCLSHRVLSHIKFSPSSIKNKRAMSRTCSCRHMGVVSEATGGHPRKRPGLGETVSNPCANCMLSRCHM